MKTMEAAEADKVIIPVSQSTTLKSGTSIVSGLIRASDLVDRFEIPHHDYHKKTGYQRAASRARVNRLAVDLRAGLVDLPTALLLNLRGYQKGSHLVEEEDGRLYLHLNGSKLFVVDGQHRAEALRKLTKDEPDKWNHFKVPFVCMLGAREGEEMKQFHVVNSTAKSVRTDLALSLLRERAKSDPAYRTSLIKRDETWKVHAQDLAEEIAKLPTWQGRIRFPGDTKASTTISYSAMVTSLKRPLSTPFFGHIDQGSQVQVLRAFWGGVQDVLPEPFLDPTNYVLQKTIGTLTMHSLLETIVEIIRSRGGSPTDPMTYSDLLYDTLRLLQGETVDFGVVEGPDFWRSGAQGSAGAFSSNAGRRMLLAKLRHGLPSISLQ